ncbi:hypothetical protein [Meiothermus sp. CFH 77666]|uniref:hypothetical protein n=1 Tax=Meiothermus sp. CFH 77666 TaxID=2817942 RepID=UPI001AA08AB8|nr:hypothetical protein [Meiothermus sp. CFH 77666]MBO1436851.1 hypothetical protein [Meiothermus sp. CFH 77666]
MKTLFLLLALGAALLGLSFLFQGGYWRQGIPWLNRRLGMEEPRSPLWVRNLERLLMGLFLLGMAGFFLWFALQL